MASSGDSALLDLEVGAIAAGGGCVGRAPDGRVVFVRHSLPGERVIARVTATNTKFLRADAVEILTPSPDRVSPPCPHAGPGRCGGCDFQHVELGAQRRLKAFRVAEQLARVAGMERAIEVEPLEGDVGGLRWRTRVRVAVDEEGAVGFRKHRSHELEHVEDCPVAGPAVVATGALATRWPGVAELEVVTGSIPGEALLSVATRGRSTPRLPGHAADGVVSDGIGLVVRGKVVRPPGAVHVTVHGRTYRISAGVFWQVHTGAAAALLHAVLAMVGDCTGRHVVDLYAGAGLFAVPLAEAAGPTGSVLAVERDTRACADAQHNGAGLPALQVTRAAVSPRLVATALGSPDIVVLDPAREGAGEEVMRALAVYAATVKKIVYVSCDPASFARDLRVLLDEGWRLAELRAFDIFPMTEHVELVAAIEPYR
jgi:tRNA/tmRNA/rRNA uracil-C5-methylase (TrmA/RlmC/RlmD family)